MFWIKDEWGAPDRRRFPDRTMQPWKIWSWDRSLLDSGDSPVWDPRNGSGWERGSFLSVQVTIFFTGRG